MTKPAAFAATYADWKLIRTRKCVQVVFEVPLEAANEAHAALGGMPNPAAEAWFAIARLDVSKVQQTEEVVETANSPSTMSQPASANPPGRAPDKKLSQLAGMLSKTPLFQRWLETKAIDGHYDEESAAQFIRDYCGVKSRSEITAGSTAAMRFTELYDNFIRWRDADQYVEAS